MFLIVSGVSSLAHVSNDPHAQLLSGKNMHTLQIYNEKPQHLFAALLVSIKASTTLQIALTTARQCNRLVSNPLTAYGDAGLCSCKGIDAE
jgi:hypothetical protein